MIGNTPALVTPEEVVRLALSYATARDVWIALDIANEWKKQASGKDGDFSLYWLYAAIFEAGRIQGIREERNRRRV